MRADVGWPVLYVGVVKDGPVRDMGMRMGMEMGIDH